jgi:hypothetical protein
MFGMAGSQPAQAGNSGNPTNCDNDFFLHQAEILFVFTRNSSTHAFFNALRGQRASGCAVTYYLKKNR